MRRSDTRPNINGVIFAVLFVLAMTWRVPILFQDGRVGMVFMLMAAVLIALSSYIAFVINLWVGAFLALCAVASVYPVNNVFSQHAMLMVLLGAIWYIVSFHAVQSDTIKNVALAVFCLAALCNVVALFFQAMGWNSVLVLFPKFGITNMVVNPKTGLASGDIVVGLLDARNSVSAMLAMCLPAFLNPRWLLLFVPIVLVGLVMAKSVGGMMASIPFFMYLGWKFWPVVSKRFAVTIPPIAAYATIITILICSGILFIKYVDVPGINGRWAAWRVYGDMNIQHPITGAGLGQWKVVFTRKDIRKKICRDVGCDKGYNEHPELGIFYGQAHNEAVQANFEIGPLSILVIVGFFVSMLRRARRSDPRSVLAVLAITMSSMVWFVFHIPILAMASLTWLAILEKDLRCSGLSYSYSQ